MDTHGNSADDMADRADIAHNYHAARRRALAGFTAAAVLLLLLAESQPSDRPAAPAAPLAIRDYELERQLGIMDTEGDYELEVEAVEVEVVAYANSWSEENPYQPPARVRRSLEASSGDCGSGEGGSGEDGSGESGSGCDQGSGEQGSGGRAPATT